MRERLEAVRAQIAAAGSDPAGVSVIAVTKGFPTEVVDAALGAGLADLGENYAQELVAKAEELAGRAAPTGQAAAADAVAVPRWQFIGHLQRNKVRRLAAHVHRFQSVDRPELVDELVRRAPGARVLLQVNTTGEAQKAGCSPEAVGPLLEGARAGGLVVEGLMTVGPTQAGAPARPAFAALRGLVDRFGLEVCSMGMTDDLDVAVGEGSTMIRVGRALFGPRPRREATAG
ncbi:MAG: YggS family pyridoxal phosphate-dependent enzyme [Acidimicrobiia bacterium]|nr:YggS family pyridoxal phosphate-dependent enzyme [Acidimicrobiia bacterium]